MLGLEDLSRADRRVVSQARRIERFLTQPFLTTEQFTGTPGRMVPLSKTIEGCERILADDCNDWPESALYMIGGLDEAHRVKPPDRQHDRGIDPAPAIEGCER